MLLDLIIAVIVMFVVVAAIKFLWGYFEMGPGLHIVLMIIGAIFIIYILIAVWPYVANPGAWRH